MKIEDANGRQNASPDARARCDNTELATRARARARARGEFCIVHNRKVGASVGLLKGPQKFQIQFLELHGDFSIVDNTELPTSAMLAWKLK